MDIRIVNTCNNNCLFCLEQSYRTRQKYISLDSILKSIKEGTGDQIINFYGGNPILHPNLLDIINIAKYSGFKSIGLLTNSFGLDKLFLHSLTGRGLNSLGIYVNSFHKQIHDKLTNRRMLFRDLVRNLFTISELGIFIKVIIHVNALNLPYLSRDLEIAYLKFGFRDFEFINYFPFDRPYDRYKAILAYDIDSNRNYIDNIFSTIKILDLHVKFYKFPKEFFGKYLEYYSFQEGILKQIGEEDTERIGSSINPFCLQENRCRYCFIKDNCRFYV